MTAKLIATVVAVLGGAFLLIFNSLDDTSKFAHVNEVIAHPQKWEGKSLDVHGYAVPGTIKEQIVGQRLERSFELEYCGKTIPIRHSGPKPDTFKEQAETVVKGKLVRENGRLYVHAIDGEPGIIAKCPSKYEGNRQEVPQCDVN